MVFRIYFFILIPLFCSTQIFAQKYNAEVVNYTTTCEVSGQTLLKSHSVTIQINNRIGDKYGEFEIPYSKDIKIDELNAWIETHDGTVIRKLKKGDIKDRSAFTGDLYSDRYVKEFMLKHNVHPYKVVVNYTTVSKNFMSIEDWTPVFYTDVPTTEALLRIKLPEGYKYKKYTVGISNPEITTSEKQQILEYRSAYIEPVKEEIYSIASRKFPRVIVVPSTFHNEISGSWESWRSYGDWVCALNEGMDILPESEKQKVGSLIDGITDKREIVKVLYHYLQDNTRYINVTIGIGALKPHPAEYVCRNKYGDCKALTNYMKSLLAFAGIESYYTLVNASDPPEDFITLFPYHQFNHAVLAVPLDNDTIWLENTSNINPFGYMGISTSNRYALLVNEGNSKLVKVPPLNASDISVTQNMKFVILKDGDAEVGISNLYKGGDFEMLNHLLLFYNNDDKDRIIRRSMMFDNYEVLYWNMHKKHRDSACIELDVKLKLGKFVTPLGNDHFFTLNQIAVPRFTTPANRKLPVLLPYPILLTDTLNYIFPEGYKMKNAFPPVYINSPYGEYAIEINETPQGITAVKSLKLNAGDYSHEKYADFYNFIDQVNRHDKLKIVIREL